MADGSRTPLGKKLGLGKGHEVALLSPPADLLARLSPLPDGVKVSSTLRGSRLFDIILLFTRRRSELERRFALLARRIVPNGGIWIAWPKRASGVETDLGEDVVRQVALSAGLVDNKVCAIDEVWSGLRCVIRKADRER